MLSSPQRLTHRGAGFGFAYSIKVAVDISGGAHIAVTEPFLNRFKSICLRHFQNKINYCVIIKQLIDY